MTSDRLRRTFTTLLIVFIIIMGVVGAFFVGYFIGGEYDLRSFFNSNCETETKNTEGDNSTKTSITDSKIAALVPSLLRGVDCWAIEEYANDRKVVANDISNQRAYAVAESNNFYLSGKRIIPYQDVQNEIIKYFGRSYQFNPETIDYQSNLCPQYDYLKDTQEFAYKPRDCREICADNTSYYKAVKAEKNKDTVSVTVRVLFGSREGTNFYQDYGKTKFVTDNPNELASAISQGGEYLFTFKEENGNYVFVSSEPLK